VKEVATFGAEGPGGRALPDQAVLSGSRRASRASLLELAAPGAKLCGWSGSVGPWGVALGRSPGNGAGLRACSRSEEKSPRAALAAWSLAGRAQPEGREEGAGRAPEGGRSAAGGRAAQRRAGPAGP